MKIDDLTHTIIGCAYKVHRTLGAGFLEKVYENALKIELDRAGIIAKQQEEIQVWYQGHVVGDYYPDLWIEGLLIIEVKGVQTLQKEHEVQLVNYLTATGVNDGLLINFGSSVQVKRKFREYKPKGSVSNAILPDILSDEDEGIAEALQRDAEIEADSAPSISLAELDSKITDRRG